MVTISAPVINDLGLLRVTLTNQTQIRHSSVSFGTFGYCILDVPPDKYGSTLATVTGVDTDDAFAALTRTIAQRATLDMTPPMSWPALTTASILAAPHSPKLRLALPTA